VGGFFLRQRLVRKHSMSFENLEITKLTENGKVKNVAISPDGQYIAYSVYLGEKQALHLRQVATGGEVEILPPDLGDFVGLAFSPDANYIYFVRSDRNDLAFRYLYTIPSLGGTPTKLITDVDSGVSFSPDGRKIVYEHWDPPRNEAEVKVAESDGSNPRVLTIIPKTSFIEAGSPGPSWSPDGKTITVSKHIVGRPHSWVLFAISYPDGNSRELYASFQALGRPVWRPEGDRLLVPLYGADANRMQLWTVDFPRGDIHRFTHDASNYELSLDITRDGRTGVA